MAWYDKGLLRWLRRRLTRGYDGAGRGRRTDGWRTPSSSANAEIAAAGTLLRDRARDLVRNNPHAAKAVSVLVNNLVGAGVTARAATGDPGLDRLANAAWARFQERCDADGQLDFAGLQTLAVRAMVESGEVLVRRLPRGSRSGLAAPLQLQVLEGDLLDSGRTESLATGGRIIQGVEFDADGRRRAYWLFPDHPGEVLLPGRGWGVSKPLPAGEFLHLYEKQRPGQVRGVPWLAPVIRRLRDLDDYEEAELVRKKIEACVTAIVFGAEDGDEGIAPSVVDADGRRVESFEPGLIAYARGGKDIKFSQPATVGGYGEYKRAMLHTVAAGARITYELLSSDLSQVNYSSIRAGLVEFRRWIDALQWQVVIPMLCEPVWRWFVDTAFAAGILPTTEIRAEWQPPRFDAVDPLKDAMADLLAMRSGTLSLPQAIARQGYNPEALLSEIAATNALLDRLGLILDSDPRRVTKTGVAQSTADTAPLDELAAKLAAD